MSKYFIIVLCLYLCLLILPFLFVRQAKLKEFFNSQESKTALYENPNLCPFESIEIVNDNPNLIVKSKLKNGHQNLDHVYRSIGEFLTDWKQLEYQFPNVKKCDNPYEQYIEQLKNNYQKLKKLPSLNITTTPIYEGMTSNQNLDTDHSSDYHQISRLILPSIYTNRNITIRSLVPSNYYPFHHLQTPNVPQLDTKKEYQPFDESVRAVSDPIPSVYTDQNIQLFKQQMLLDRFEQEREYNKQILSLNAEIDKLKREIEYLRQQLVNEKRHFEELDRTIEEKHQQILKTNNLNQILTSKSEQLNRRIKQLEEMYLQSDSQRTVLEVRLANLRKHLENQKNQLLPFTITEWESNPSRQKLTPIF